MVVAIYRRVKIKSARDSFWASWILAGVVCVYMVPAFGMGARARGPQVVLTQNDLKFLDLSKLLSGYEFTAQDLSMAQEPYSQNIYSTPEKRNKGYALLSHLFQSRYSDTALSDFSALFSKPGWGLLDAEGRSKASLTMEPQCVELNQEPVLYQDFENHWDPVYLAAEKADLKPSLHPAGFATGSGHFHIGTEDISENPFVKHPWLLRNLLAFMHQHPATIYGLSSAWEFGGVEADSIDHPFADLYDKHSQEKLAQGIQKFDTWARQVPKEILAEDGLDKMLSIIRENLPRLFSHQAFVNVRNFYGQKKSNARTFEFRMIRPLPSAKHGKAVLGFLIKMMDHCAQDKPLRFRPIPLRKMPIFLSPHYLEQDWYQIEEALNWRDPLLRELLYATTRNKELKTKTLGDLKKSIAYSRNGVDHVEIRTLKKDESTRLIYQGKEIHSEEVSIAGKVWLVGVVREAHGFDPRDTIADLACRNALKR